jgi:hypothetical protein
MLKIYLDWNCITHLKDKKDIYDFLIQYHNVFIFPYSPAHFEDLQRSLLKEDKSQKYYKEDLTLLSEICEDNLIMYDPDKDRVMPYKASPEEYLSKSDADTSIDQIYKYATFTEYLKNNLNEENHEFIIRLLDQINIDNIKSPLSDKPINSYIELLNLAWALLHNAMTTNNYNRKVLNLANEDANEILKNISGSNPNNVFEEINNQFKKIGSNGDVMLQIENILKKDNKDTELAKFISFYLTLDFSGFQRDKNHNLLNISTDANHGYYASYCDVLVSDDKKMREKNEAVYKKLGINTKVITSDNLVPFMESEIEREYNLMSYFNKLATNLNFHKVYNKGDVHTRTLLFDNPMLGIFNCGIVQYFIDTKNILYTFKICMDKQKYIFFTEIDRFYELIRKILNNKTEIENFNSNFVEKIKVKDDTASYTMNIDDKWIVALTNDNDNKGLPVMCVTRNIIKSKWQI